MDLNIDNYTNDELIEILELNDPSNENIIMKTDFYIDKFKKEGKNDYVSFFLNVQKVCYYYYLWNMLSLNCFATKRYLCIYIFCFVMKKYKSIF